MQKYESEYDGLYSCKSNCHKEIGADYLSVVRILLLETSNFFSWLIFKIDRFDCYKLCSQLFKLRTIEKIQKDLEDLFN